MNIRILLLFPVLLMLILCCTACGEEDDGSGGAFYTVLSDNPKNLDPQLADDEESIRVLRNIFATLVERDSNGAYICMAAKSYTVSDDGLEYIFDLRDDMKWSSSSGFNAPLVADDYIFAFQRLFSPESHSPHCRKYFCIRNSENVYNGILSFSDLGIYADDEHTLRFELEYPESDFLDLLSQSAASPCNREFFESTEGRYGLDDAYVAGNGFFTLSEWNYDPYWNENFLRLKKNGSNSSEHDRVMPASVEYVITAHPDIYEDTSGNTISCTDCRITDEPEVRRKRESYFQTKTAGLTFNPNNPALLDNNIRYALAAAAGSGLYKDTEIKGGSVAYGVVPTAVSLMGKSYREIVSEENMPVFSEKDALVLWQKGTAEADMQSLEIASIIIPESFVGAQYVYMIADRWRDILGFTCGVEILSDDDYASRIENGDYEIAVTVIESDTGILSDYLKEYEKYIYDTEILRQIDRDITAGKRSVLISDACEYYKTVEKAIIKSIYFIPLMYQSDVFIYQNGTSGYDFDPFSKSTDFRKAVNK